MKFKAGDVLCHRATDKRHILRITEVNKDICKFIWLKHADKIYVNGKELTIAAGVIIHNYDKIFTVNYNEYWVKLNE